MLQLKPIRSTAVLILLLALPASAILRDDLLAEDLVQEAWVRVYQHLADFAGRASFVAWALRITVNEGLARVRSGKRFAEQRGAPDNNGGQMESFAAPVPDPEQQRRHRRCALFWSR